MTEQSNQGIRHGWAPYEPLWTRCARRVKMGMSNNMTTEPLLITCPDCRKSLAREIVDKIVSLSGGK